MLSLSFQISTRHIKQNRTIKRSFSFILGSINWFIHFLEMSCFNLYLTPSWIFDQYKKHKLCKGSSNNKLHTVIYRPGFISISLTMWFLDRSFFFLIWPWEHTISPLGHVLFLNSWTEEKKWTWVFTGSIVSKKNTEILKAYRYPLQVYNLKWQNLTKPFRPGELTTASKVIGKIITSFIWLLLIIYFKFSMFTCKKSHKYLYIKMIVGTLSSILGPKTKPKNLFKQWKQNNRRFYTDIL